MHNFVNLAATEPSVAIPRNRSQTFNIHNHWINKQLLNLMPLPLNNLELGQNINPNFAVLAHH